MSARGGGVFDLAPENEVIGSLNPEKFWVEFGYFRSLDVSAAESTDVVHRGPLKPWKFTHRKPGRAFLPIPWDPTVLLLELQGLTSHNDGQETVSMKLTKIRNLSIKMEIRSICFLDEDSVAAITPAGDVWRIALASDRPTLLFSKNQVLKPIAQALDIKSVEPAKGGYPRLFVSRRADWLIVNTHDFVLVACHLETDQSIRLVATSWGQYYPSLTFSADGRWLCARSDETVLYDLHSWKWQILKSSSCAAWYPGQSALLILDNEGHLSRMDIERGTPPDNIGSLPSSSDLFANPVVDMCISLSGQHAVLAYEKGDLEWWQLSPFQNIARVPIGDREIVGMTASLGKQCIASETETGIRFYHLETQKS